jgi:hypothetical protein
MMARSTKYSNQRPDTLMQDHTSANSMKVLLQHTAGPYIWVKSGGDDRIQTTGHVRFALKADMAGRFRSTRRAGLLEAFWLQSQNGETPVTVVPLPRLRRAVRRQPDPADYHGDTIRPVAHSHAPRLLPCRTAFQNWEALQNVGR